MQTKMYNPEMASAIKFMFITFAGVLLGVLPEPSGNLTWDGFFAAMQPFSYLATSIAAFMACRHWYYATKKLNEKKQPKNDGKGNRTA